MNYHKKIIQEGTSWNQNAKDMIEMKAQEGERRNSNKIHVLSITQAIWMLWQIMTWKDSVPFFFFSSILTAKDGQQRKDHPDVNCIIGTKIH